MAAPGDAQPTQEELEAFFAQLRDLPSGELIMQAMSTLAAGAQAKLGRRDARVLIDTMDALLQASGEHLGPAKEQIADTIGQLKLAQVQLEKQMAAEEGQAGDAAATGVSAPSGAEPDPAEGPSEPASQAGPQQSQQKMTDRLWIPGR